VRRFDQHRDYPKPTLRTTKRRAILIVDGAALGLIA